MWFKNLRLYCLVSPFDLSIEELEASLAEHSFTPCASYEKSRIGWVSPLGDAAPIIDEEDVTPMLTHVIGDYIMLCAQKQDRLLPASVVREATAERVAELEQRQARKIYRKEKREIQDDVFSALLPRAFPRSSKTFAYISRADNLLVVDSASAPRAEELINLLRDSLGSIPLAIPDSKRAPGAVMTHWLKNGKATDHFEIHDACELVNPLDATNVVRCKNQELDGDEIEAHLAAGKQVKQLNVRWNNQLNCNILDDLSIKQLQFEEIKEEAESFDEESAAQKFDQEFSLMTLQLSAFFKSLFNAFGGLEDPDKKVLPDNRNKEEA
ncbi:MAG: recombination-associated protein RdgC [Gammaproteobacteria bacterium]|nr:recombination-associated protein RdgC [Gammaproteobacteria bacterium]MAY03696.1 recombination-associated protein RdgC [Gammaproteobacteria bacterium]|tara:strand:+ start:757 stop:1731 length:975 start_codon:yes stop_codon:yes gene_type:complete